MATLPFLYQLQNASFGSLSTQSFRTAVVDMDKSGLTASQVQTLHSQNKILYTYLSIGEAEDYRAYWEAGNWSQRKPSFVLGENPDWPGNFSVKFWDPAWQKIMYARVDDAIARGYDGIYLDIVDAYEVAQVRAAYTGPSIRQAMIDFVVGISKHAKALDPDFKIIPQNAVGLLALSESNPSVPNTAYLNAIDGVGVEDLWYDGNSTSSWTSGDLQFLKNAVNANKFVLATSYPTDDAKQADFVNKAIAAGFVPFVADRDLTGKIDPIDLTIDGRLVGHDIDTPWGQVPTTPIPPIPPVTNVAPVAIADAYNVAHDKALVVGLAQSVLANDTDANGNKLTAVAVTGASHGTVVLKSDGSFTYTPTAGFSGQDSFTYKANDGSANSNVVTVKLNVAAAATVPPPADSHAGNEHLTGTSSADTMDGGAGSDLILGMRGNDTLHGGIGDDTVNGGSGNDMLYGDAGNDYVIGERGNDTLNGGVGNDVLLGGSGRDIFIGSVGADRMVFQSIDDTGGSSWTRDIIMDFDPTMDRIDLSRIDANIEFSGNQAFTLLATAGAAFTAAGQLHLTYTTVNGVAHTIIEGNVNKTLGADFQIDLVGHIKPAADDFML